MNANRAFWIEKRHGFLTGILFIGVLMSNFSIPVFGQTASDVVSLHQYRLEQRIEGNSIKADHTFLMRALSPSSKFLGADEILGADEFSGAGEISGAGKLSGDVMNSTTGQSGVFETLRTKPGAAFLSSAVLPGSSQLANRSFVRGAIYLAIEAAAITIHATQQSKARSKEASYERYANGNWSVVKYARWLVDYHDFHELDNPYIEELRGIVNGAQPAYDITVDWKAIPIQLLRNVERNTLYVYMLSLGANTFSHVMPDYGSQQYYELISKYYQYGPGWSDFNTELYTLPWNGTAMTAQFYEGRDRAEIFNNHYRTAGNMLTLLIANHMISAFDAYFTVGLKQSKLALTTGTDFNQPLNLRLSF